ncbi:MAG TPA: hypothetical protein VFL13_07910 [Candidatus Baltobacteraceae bacterium]|nr:hypothetical protein [Candidatus Baltobacteraceae bacterium]
MKRFVLILAGGALLSACGGGGGILNGNSYTPTQTPGNALQTSKIQLAVGTARLPDGTTGLNVVTTFRQTNGLSATLVNTPSITGPAGFVVPATSFGTGNGDGGSGTDAGTHSITAQAQTFQPLPATNTTFGVVGGDFASGLIDLNNDTNGNQAFYPGSASGPNPAWGEPFYLQNIPFTGTLPAGVSSVPAQPYIVGPPAVPFFNDGTEFSSFAGYMTGFNAFKATPASGQYTITDVVATTNQGSPSFSASATLTNLTPLPALPAPTFTSDGTGGGTASIVVPSDPRIAETLIYIVDVGAKLYYTSAPLTGTGTLTFTLANNLGVCTVLVSGCQTSHPGVSITSGDQYLVYAASFDYKQLEAEPPGNTSQLPAITGSGGQADISLSPALSGTY